MPNQKYLLSLGLLTLAACAPVLAQTAAEAVVVDDPYIRAVPPGQPNSASFMGLHNGSGQDHALVAARTPAAQVVELHTHRMKDGMMSMRRIDQVDLPAGEKVSLEPGGLHVMLIGLERKLEPGQEIPLTLVFEDGSERPISAEVRKIQVEMQHHHHHH